MTNLAICPKCRALTPDTDDDVAEHRRKAHTEPEGDIERARKAASDATTALKSVQASLRDYEKALDQRPIPVEPEITMRVVEPDEIAAIDAATPDQDEPTTTNLDDVTYDATTALAESPLSSISGLYSPGQVNP